MIRKTAKDYGALYMDLDHTIGPREVDLGPLMGLDELMNVWRNDMMREAIDAS